MQYPLDPNGAVAGQVAEEDKVAPMDGHPQTWRQVFARRVDLRRCRHGLALGRHFRNKGGRPRRRFAGDIVGDLLKVCGGARRQDQPSRRAHLSGGPTETGPQTIEDRSGVQSRSAVDAFGHQAAKFLNFKGIDRATHAPVA